MTIGAIVEKLIRLKGDYQFTRNEEETINQACNLLDKLPRLEEAMDYESKPH